MTKCKLGDILEVKRGTTLSGNFYSTSGSKIRLTLGNFDYPGGGFKENDSKDNIYFTGEVKNEFILKKGDIITPLTEQVKGLLGETARIPLDDLYIQSGDVGLIIPNEKLLDNSFAYYLVSSPAVKKQLGAAAQQTKIRHTSPEKIKQCTIWLPDLRYQHYVGLILDAINNKIMCNRTINAELESLAKTIYDYWFLQFDFPNKEGKPYKSSDGAMVWNEDLKKEIPEGWRTCRLGDMTDLYLGGTPKTEIPSYWNGDINWLSSGEISQFPVVSAETKITEDGLNNSATKLMQKGTVVVSITGNIRVSILAIDSCANQSVVGINENEILKNSYIYPVVGHLLNHYGKLSTGNCQQHINKNTLEETIIVVPPKEVLDKYYAVVNPMYEKIMNTALESQTLKETRDFLLPLLMNGQVGFKDA